MAQEVREWIAEEIIDSRQGKAILDRYGASLDTKSSSSFGYYVLTALSVLFAGLALILVLSHNWDQIPRAIRMLGLVFLTFAVNLQGLRLLYNHKQSAGVLWLFFGSICYGSTIMLIAQIYHLGEHFPDGIFYWALGILPLIFITRSRLLAFLCLTLATIWMLVEAEADFFPVLYPIYVTAAFWLSWIRRDSTLLFLGSLFGLVFWINLLLAWIAGDFNRFNGVIDQFCISIGCGLLLAGISWRLIRSKDTGLQNYGHHLHLWILRASLFFCFCSVLILYGVNLLMTGLYWDTSARYTS